MYLQNISFYYQNQTYLYSIIQFAFHITNNKKKSTHKEYKLRSGLHETTKEWKEKKKKSYENEKERRRERGRLKEKNLESHVSHNFLASSRIDINTAITLIAS